MSDVDVLNLVDHIPDSDVKAILIEILKKLIELDSKVEESLTLDRLNNEYLNSR